VQSCHPLRRRSYKELTRTRKQLVHETSEHSLRIQSGRGCQSQVGSVLSNVLGCIGRVMLEAIFASEHDPERLANTGLR